MSGIKRTHFSSNNKKDKIMTAKTSKETVKAETVMDDVFEDKAVEAKAVVEAIVDVDEDKLAKLKARLAGQSKEKVVKKERSLNMAIIGTGQGGSRIAAAFYKLGVDAIALNTAQQDLKFIDLPQSNKLLLEFGGPGGGGAAKSLEIGHNAAEQNADKILEMVNKHFADADLFMISTSLGGGSGSGSLNVLISLLSTIGKPIIVMAILPSNSEDILCKSNSIETLHKLTSMIKRK